MNAFGNDDNDYGLYNNLAGLTTNYQGSGKQHQFFILPEFQKFQHTFRKLNPRLLQGLDESNLWESAGYLE